MKKSYVLTRVLAFALAAAMLFCLCACGDEAGPDGGEPAKLSFKSAASYADLKKLSGQTVTINGYMATSSPVDGSFIFLMNLPYQSCPFCKPNTSQLSNTMEVYPKKNASFKDKYTTQAIKVTGKLVVTDNENESFTDRYGYEFNFKIVDATFEIIKAEELSAEYALWQKIASSDVINEIYNMYNYTNFLCAWPTYFIDSYVDKTGKTQPGFYLYDSDAKNFLEKDGAQYNYGYKDGYFDNIIASIKAVDATAFDDLVQNVQKSKALAEKALKELYDGNYTSKYQYVEKFKASDHVFTLNKGEELVAEWETLYYEFAEWLGSWEM